MIRVYSYDVDFQRKVQPGDSFDVLYAGEEEMPTGGDTRNDVLFAALTVAGEPKKFYRFQTPDDNIVDYYDETGKSAKKFLVRKPLPDGIMRSCFGVRKHPILGYAKMHTGVDWAAPHGTPIFAAGNGVVEKVGWEGGYGKYVRVKHNNGYETAYGHMTAYARGIEPGVKVRQGQVHRLRRLDRPVDRRASALRDHGQRPLRRSDAYPSAARPRAGKPVAHGLRDRTRPPRRHDGARQSARRRQNAHAR